MPTVGIGGATDGGTKLEIKELLLLPGHVELTFANGQSARGEVLEVLDERFRFRPYDGLPFAMPVNRVIRARPISDEERLSAQARVLADSGRLADAVELLEEALEEAPPLGSSSTEGPSTDPGPWFLLYEQLLEYQRQLQRAHATQRNARGEEFRKELDDLIDKGQWLEALERVKLELKADPDNSQLLAEAVWIEYRIHRGRAGQPEAFRSFLMDRLMETDPASTLLAGIAAEMKVSAHMQLEWAKEREQLLTTGYQTALEHYENFRLEAAREILERALAFHPPNEQAAPMRALLERVDAELAAESTDRTADRLQWRREQRTRAESSVRPAGSLSERGYENMKQRIHNRR
jgi:tetratricopeptide (TPR) repeat protein